MIVVVTELLGNGTMDWLPHMGFVDAFDDWRGIHGFAFVWRAQPWIDLLLLAAGLLAVYRLRDRPAVALTLVLLVIAAPLTIWAIGFVQPLYLERTVAWTFVGTPLLIGGAPEGRTRLADPDHRAADRRARHALGGVVPPGRRGRERGLALGRRELARRARVSG